jgi:hypothetical protein
MEQWFALEEICKSIVFSSDCDSLIWTYTANGQYSTSSLYNIISFRGVTPIHIPAVWSLVVPPRVHIFLWLLANNKLMTRDNLEKRHLGKPISCEFCSENESISHLFFECIVAKRIWISTSNFLNLQLGSDFESIAKYWLANKKHSVTNSICAAILWSIWKTRNAMIFDNQLWLCSKQVWWLILKTIRKWKLIWKEEMLEKMDQFTQHISSILRAPEALPW